MLPRVPGEGEKVENWRRNRLLQPKPAFSRFPSVHPPHLEGQQRVGGGQSPSRWRSSRQRMAIVSSAAIDAPLDLKSPRRFAWRATLLRARGRRSRLRAPGGFGQRRHGAERSGAAMACGSGARLVAKFPHNARKLHFLHSNRNTGIFSAKPFSRRSPSGTKRAASSSLNSRTSPETTMPSASASLHSRDASCTVPPKRSL